VYEFSRDFRNEGIDRTHSPEFTMLEFYQAFADVHDMMTLTETLICEAVQKACGTLQIEWEGQAVDFTAPWKRMSMIDAVSEKVGESISDLDPGKLERLAKANGVETRPGMGAGGLVDELFSELVQADLQQPTFVLDHPVETSPLARVSREKPGVVERFEWYVAGMELANAFSEQNDSDAQRASFELQMQLREAGDDEAQMMDQDYVRALEYGMPPTGGGGSGIDRLVMLLTGQRNIREVILFPQLRPEEGRGDVDDEAEDAAAETSPSSASS
jgi:lysyl-tRNA synthetase class 2